MQEHKRERVKKRVSITNEDEEVITVVRQFPVVLRRPLIFGLFILLLAEVPWAIAYGTGAEWLNISYIWMAICGVFLIAYWLRCWVGWHYSVYILTNQRIMVVKQNGFFTREVADLALHNIQSVNYSIRGIQGALFGFGGVHVDTLSGSGSMELGYVHKPARLQKQIMDEVNKSMKHSKSE